MAAVDPNTKTMFANVDWEHYRNSRPPYPQSLKNLIYEHRRGNPSASWGKLVDIGSGVGVACTLFAGDFETVHSSDPSPLNQEKARVFLADWVKVNGLNTKLEFSQAIGEDAHKFVSDADLFVCGEAAHYIDVDGLINSAAKILRPGGTLAVFTYGVPLFPGQSMEFTKVYTNAILETLKVSVPENDEKILKIYSASGARAGAGPNVLDSLPVPEELFTDRVRYRMNTKANAAWHEFLNNFPVPWTPGPIRVDPAEKDIEYRSGKDAQAEGWSLVKDKMWLDNLIKTFAGPPNLQLTEEQHRKVFDDWDAIFAKECPSGKTEALFPVNMVLATRK